MIEAIALLVSLGLLVIVVARKVPAALSDVRKRQEGDGDDQDKIDLVDVSGMGRVLKKGLKKLGKGASGVLQTEGPVQEGLDRAQEMIDAGDLKAAEDLLIEMVEKDPKNPHLYNKLGFIYMKQENYTDAKEAFKASLKLDRHNDLIHNNLGLALFNQGRYIEAIEAYLKSIQLNGLVAHRYINLGLAYGALRQYEKALDAYKKALVLDKDNESYQQLVREVSDKIAELRGVE